jgi:hypothetical protein
MFARARLISAGLLAAATTAALVGAPAIIRNTASGSVNLTTSRSRRERVRDEHHPRKLELFG